MNIYISDLVYWAIEVYIWIVIARVILSWVRVNPYTPVVRFIYEVTEPVMGFFRRIIPPIGMIDLSPIALFFVLKVAQAILINLLHGVGI